VTEPTVQLAIEARGVSYTYPDGLRALEDVTFRAPEGGFVAIVGSNGSGKTTLMKILVRLLAPQAGQVRLGGAAMRDLSSREIYGRIGMVFQNPADQLFAPTVEQDVAFGPRNLGLAEAEVAARVEESLAAVDAPALRERPIHHLSFGEQKRVCLAGVLAMQPSILVLDEPTAGLDPAGESLMIDLLMRLNHQRRTTMILSTHSVDLLPILADRIYVLCKGRVLREGTPHEIFTDARAAAEAGLRLPLISQLFHELTAEDGVTGLAGRTLPLSIAEARPRILGWLDKEGLRAVRRKDGP
jgi:cobalt/nickel transport system ATP-binding protein